MSIATRSGDEGTTGLMFNRRVSKADPRVEAYGSVDELNASLGVVRASAVLPETAECLLGIQKNLVALMGELAVAPEDMARYRSSAYPKVEPLMLEQVDRAVELIEARSVKFEGWATPGATLPAAHLDVARTVCRRAERAVVRLGEQGGMEVSPLIVRYLNRLADLLWLMARLEESRH
ncbi:MAG: cob(I)yrinic acid a,c-diamide adenosyltransferase [Bacteroidia bacterium]|nr:cob(I)yrinic acid a,c-diamide adenosyltransferase [Bacteroidia bacterium]